MSIPSNFPPRRHDTHNEKSTNPELEGLKQKVSSIAHATPLMIKTTHRKRTASIITPPEAQAVNSFIKKRKI